MAQTKQKGDIAEAMIMADLMQSGHKILLPFGEDWKFDMAIYNNGKFIRVQCKYDGGRVDGIVDIRCRSLNNWVTHKYTPLDIDYIAVYHKPSNRCYYMPSSLLGKNGRNQIYLRLKPAKNNQKKGILLAKDYMEFKLPE